MGSFGLPVIDAKIISARCFKAFMSQNRFDMANRAAVEKQSGCCGMPENMRAHFFLDAGNLSVSIKIAPEVTTSKSISAILADEERRAIVASGLKISLDPDEGTG